MDHETLQDYLADKAGVTWFDHQLEFFAALKGGGPTDRHCLYYRTGAGKSITSLAGMYLMGVLDVLVIAPPSTHKEWAEQAAKLDMHIDLMSHAKFRMPGTKLRRDQAVIADEMHMFGGHKGKGWQKLSRLAKGLQRPMILASATPSYNDADRVYCVQHILDPIGTKGGFLEFLYKNCTTEQNPFAMMPNVTGFIHFDNAAEYLASLPNVHYLPDDLVYNIEEFSLPEKTFAGFHQFGLDLQSSKMIASGIEKRHAIVRHTMMTRDRKTLSHAAADLLDEMLDSTGSPVIIFCMRSEIARAVAEYLRNPWAVALYTGDETWSVRKTSLEFFKKGDIKILVGTAALATGTDGLDKVCDSLIIFDDTDDDAQRRQLIGRIMPRGADNDASKKRVLRVNIK